MSLPYAYNTTTSCKKLEKFHERILRSSSDARTDGRTNGRKQIHRSHFRFAGDQKSCKQKSSKQKKSCKQQKVQEKKVQKKIGPKNIFSDSPSFFRGKKIGPNKCLCPIFCPPCFGSILFKQSRVFILTFSHIPHIYFSPQSSHLPNPQKSKKVSLENEKLLVSCQSKW